MFQKLRRSTELPDHELLHEKAKVDETYVGASGVSLRGRQVERKSTVVDVVEVRGTASRRAGLQIVSDASGPSLPVFVGTNKEARAIVITDDGLGTHTSP
jgi:hypothetical protein